MFQQSDLNKDTFLDKRELDSFVRNSINNVFTESVIDDDTIETAVVIADTMFDEADASNMGQLSFKGTLLFRSPANMLGEKIANMIVDLVTETDALEKDSSLNQF
ncbi:unnamed protein product [Bursaphelenchus okinawaensis]|uniref:EF-hand domain-containing protein n=1 Tax=Bursaphelenchus okinawaensis TaxID=465554 RepID=A0A811KV99_9BILA|nr:unnamed protein product [Bursaphelenchus okinawaensis]CAG9112150.1 unnamed protein product [Bursaphelenchus okinawaensis]